MGRFTLTERAIRTMRHLRTHLSARTLVTLDAMHVRTMRTLRRRLREGALPSWERREIVRVLEENGVPENGND